MTASNVKVRWLHELVDTYNLSQRLLVLTLVACTVSTCSVMAGTIVSSQSPPTLVGEASTHIVVPGEGLYALARRNGLAYPAIARANAIADPNLIRAGRELTLPTRLILPVARDDGIVVNIPECRLFFFRGGILRAVYPVTTGLPTWQTPLGSFTVTTKLKNPTWYMPPDLARREKVKREVVPPGPDNPLGDFWIGTSLKHTGIHSTNNPMTVGRDLSHGCLRLYPEHVEALFKEVTIGETGEIVYEPVKVALEGDDLLVEIHPDLYGLVPDVARAAEEQLRALGVWERVDLGRLRQAVAEARGIPVSVRVRFSGDHHDAP